MTPPRPFCLFKIDSSSSQGIAARRRRLARPSRLACEVLECRIAPATFLVVNALDGTGNGPSGSLRNAIAQADQSGDASDVIVITPKVRGPIALDSGELTIDSSLSIVNRSGRPVEIRQTTQGARVFDISSNPQTVRVNIRAASGREAVTIDGGNVSTGNGGGILVEDPASVLTLTHVRLIGNSAGLASTSNLAQNGGGIYSSGSVVLKESTVGTAVAPNQTCGDGGAIWAGAGVLLTGAMVDGNRAGTDAGGLLVSSGTRTCPEAASIKIEAFNIGGIDEVKGDVRVVRGSEVNGNSSTALLDVSAGDFGGGAIAEGVGDVFVSRSQVSDNHSVGMYSSGIVVGAGQRDGHLGQPGQLEQCQRAGRRYCGQLRRDRDRQRRQSGRSQHGLGDRRGDRELHRADGRRSRNRAAATSATTR